MVRKNPPIGIKISIWSTRQEEMYFVMQKGMRQRSQPKKGKGFPCYNADFLLVFCCGELRVKFQNVNMLNITMNEKSIPLFLLSIDKN
jgi:hypothetical protein